MAERVEVVRVGAGAKAVEIGKMTAEKHSIGTYKASEVGSWEVGITTREHKLGRIDQAAKWNKEVEVAFEQWCKERNLTVNPGIVGLFRKIARIYVRNGPKHAEILLDVVPPAYRGFWDQYKEMLISGYTSVRP
jgi:hypothetical protein